MTLPAYCREIAADTARANNNRVADTSRDVEIPAAAGRAASLTAGCMRARVRARARAHRIDSK